MSLCSCVAHRHAGTDQVPWRNRYSRAHCGLHIGHQPIEEDQTMHAQPIGQAHLQQIDLRALDPGVGGRDGRGKDGRDDLGRRQVRPVFADGAVSADEVEGGSRHKRSFPDHAAVGEGAVSCVKA
jgi:hypothetical protein